VRLKWIVLLLVVVGSAIVAGFAAEFGQYPSQYGWLIGVLLGSALCGVAATVGR